ncbi:MAG: response regulator [Geobacteraceae bacterium]
MGKILIIDDDETFTQILSDYISAYYPLLQVEICSNPVQVLAILRKRRPDLLLVDLEMPTLDGNKILRFATDMGINKNRIVILSGRDADYLHERFPLGTCLAVLNKFEARQKAVLDMIFSSLQKKTTG